MWWIVAVVAFLLLTHEDLVLNVKAGVRFKELTDQMQHALHVVQTIWKSFGLGPPTVTSANDGLHMTGSLHFANQAVDIRLNDVDPDLREALRIEVAEQLGSNYDVLLEYPGSDRVHLHIEYDPKGERT